MLVEFVLHGPSSAFPCVTNDYAPYKQQVLFAVLHLYATDPRVCDVAAAAAGNGAEDLGTNPQGATSNLISTPRYAINRISQR